MFLYDLVFQRKEFTARNQNSMAEVADERRYRSVEALGDNGRWLHVWNTAYWPWLWFPPSDNFVNIPLQSTIQIQTSCTERDAMLTSEPIPETITGPLMNVLSRLYDRDQEICSTSLSLNASSNNPSFFSATSSVHMQRAFYATSWHAWRSWRFGSQAPI